jgi:periplasmic divalent cation tolerance protein
MSAAEEALVVLVTAPSEDVAKEIGRRLVDERLAACVNVVPGVTSIYRWEGARQEAPESLLVIKTRSARYADLERRVLDLHPYSVPEVVAVPVETGAAAYLRWVCDSVPAEGR